MRRILMAAGVAPHRSPPARRPQDYPNRPIRVFTTSSAGGISDVFMRVLDDALHKRLGQPLIIENKPGGAGNIAARACQDAAPDGYTICIINADPMVYNQFLFKKLPFEPDKLTPIVNLFHLIQVLVVNSNLKVKTVDELVALSKQKPGTLNYLTASMPLVVFMEQHEEGERRRLGARAVPRRRRGDQRRARRLDADRAHRPRQRHRPHPGRQDDGAGAHQQHPHAAGCRTCRPSPTSATRARPPPPGTGCSRRPARRRRSSTSSTPKSARWSPTRRSSEKFIIARGLVPAINSSEEFAAEIKADRALAEQVVKESGLTPQ